MNRKLYYTNYAFSAKKNKVNMIVLFFAQTYMLEPKQPINHLATAAGQNLTETYRTSTFGVIPH